MGWLKEVQGAASHKGQVVVTRKEGGSITFVDLAAAEAALGSLKGGLRYFRGAFFETGASKRADAGSVEAPAPKAPPAPKAAPTPEPTPREAKRRRRDAEGDAEA